MKLFLVGKKLRSFKVQNMEIPNEKIAGNNRKKYHKRESK